MATVDIVMLMHHDDVMRTTLNIDDDVLRVLRGITESRRESMGKVVSDLVRKALAPRDPRPVDESIPVFRVSVGAPAITLADVKRAEEEP
jgi:hypothetical protein